MKTYHETNQLEADPSDIYLQVLKLEFEQAAIRPSGPHSADPKCKQLPSKDNTVLHVGHKVESTVVIICLCALLVVRSVRTTIPTIGNIDE